MVNSEVTHIGHFPPNTVI